MRKCARLFCTHLPGCCGRAEGFLASATLSSRCWCPTRGALRLGKSQMQSIHKRVCLGLKSVIRPGASAMLGFS